MMINVKQRKNQDNIHLNQQEGNHKISKTGQLRRAKMHVPYLAEDIDNNNALTPSLRKLLKASLFLQTTNTKILAAYLKRPPAIIRTEFQKILAILGERGSRSLLG